MKQTQEELTCHHPHSLGAHSVTHRETEGASKLLCILFELAVIRNCLHTFLKTGELQSVCARKRGFPLYCMSLTKSKTISACVWALSFCFYYSHCSCCCRLMVYKFLKTACLPSKHIISYTE